jgi:hypothetical protein
MSTIGAGWPCSRNLLDQGGVAQVLHRELPDTQVDRSGNLLVVLVAVHVILQGRELTTPSILCTSTLEGKSIMTREALEVGAFTWGRIQRLYDADLRPFIGSAASPKASNVRKMRSRSSSTYLDFPVIPFWGSLIPSL